MADAAAATPATPEAAFEYLKDKLACGYAQLDANFVTDAAKVVTVIGTAMGKGPTQSLLLPFLTLPPDSSNDSLPMQYRVRNQPLFPPASRRSRESHAESGCSARQLLPVQTHTHTHPSTCNTSSAADVDVLKKIGTAGEHEYNHP